MIKFFGLTINNLAPIVNQAMKNWMMLSYWRFTFTVDAMKINTVKLQSMIMPSGIY